MSMTGRPKKELPIPSGLRRGMPVKIKVPEYRETKLGLIYDMCPHKDGGIRVWLTGESRPGFSVYTCVQIERGDTIESVEIER